ncbi:hypothetical protein IJ103_01945 [Candidatus Saccharibacteria bacterium]|nr:hypothetical protein [Candidatus Saccharibacteria bacterium]MBQ9016986.1 hypothetical protein [Candidatus Saccharibacteria bacterium]
MEIKNKIKTVLAAFAIVFASVFGLALPVSADSAEVICSDGSRAASFDKCSNRTAAEGRSLMNTLQTVINVVLAVLAFVTVAMIIIGGINYSTSQGDAAKVTKAKNTILYGVIGLVVALLAFAIVNFVLANLFNK